MANGAEQTRVDKAPERRSPLSTEELMTIEDESVLDKMVWPDLVDWGLAGAGTSRHQIGNDRDSVCSWIRLRTLRSGSSSGLRYVSSDKGREVESPMPPQIQLLPSLGSICGHSSSVTPSPASSLDSASPFLDPALPLPPFPRSSCSVP